MSQTRPRPARGRGPRRRGAGDGKAHDAAEVVSCLRRLFRGLHEYSKAIQRRSGLSSPQVWVLSLLSAEPGLSLAELSQRMFAHPSTVSGVVERLVERGAVRRVEDREDRRGVRLSLTPLGNELQRSSPPPVQAGLRQALAEMPEARLRLLRRSLEEIARKAEVHRLEAPLFELASAVSRRRTRASDAR